MKYYIDRLEEEEQIDARNVFVLVEGNVYYSPSGGHGELKDMKYLEECEEITLLQYKDITRGYWTPIDYLS